MLDGDASNYLTFELIVYMVQLSYIIYNGFVKNLGGWLLKSSFDAKIIAQGSGFFLILQVLYTLKL